MGLGSILGVSLAKAREKAALARSQLADRIDPIAANRRPQTVPTFGSFADELFATRCGELRSEKSVKRWERSLTLHAAPLRDIPIDAISTEDVVSVLKLIWTSKPETAQKARGHIEAVLDAAKAAGLRSGDNPARWKGHLDHLLFRHSKRTRVHHPALGFAQLPEFMKELSTREGLAARALEFTILTGARSGEVFGALWEEFDLDKGIWTVPAARMKAGREHRVPLIPAALSILGALGAEERSGLVFEGAKAGRPLSPMALTMVLRRMGRNDITVHGFRSSFRDWAGECTDYPRELAEAALAHAVGDQTERAYRRGEALERRRPMMEAWGAYLASKL